MKYTRRIVVLACMTAVSAGGAIMPAVASANTAWVNNARSVKAPYNSCQNPGYGSIQAAINGPSTTVHVCASTYKEQLQIERAVAITGETGAIVQLPASPVDSTTACAASEEQDLVGICGKGIETVKISKLTFEAFWPAGTCSDDLYAINVGGDADLLMSNSAVLGAGARPVNGCQGGVGVQIGRKFTGQVATARLTDDEISGYQKNGITVDNSGSKATIKKVIVTGAGPVSTAQNGIQISRGAQAKLTEDTITKNECEAPSCGGGSSSELEEDAAGVLFYQEGPSSSVTKSDINENDLGVSHISQSETTKPQVTITGDVMQSDRYAAVMLGQGYATVNKDEMLGGAVGVLLLQYAGQEFGPRGKGSEDKISAMSKHAVEGLSDGAPGDQFGSFTIINSQISGNPGTVGESAFTNNPEKLKIITAASDS